MEENRQARTRYPNRDERPRPIDRDPTLGAIDPGQENDLQRIIQSLAAIAAAQAQLRDAVTERLDRQQTELEAARALAEALTLCKDLTRERKNLQTLVAHFENSGAVSHWKSEAARLRAQVEALESVSRESWYSFRQIAAAVALAAILTAAGAAALCMSIGG